MLERERVRRERDADLEIDLGERIDFSPLVWVWVFAACCGFLFVAVTTDMGATHSTGAL